MAIKGTECKGVEIFKCFFSQSPVVANTFYITSSHYSVVSKTIPKSPLALKTGSQNPFQGNLVPEHFSLAPFH
jgi:hypothetical protein